MISSKINYVSICWNYLWIIEALFHINMKLIQCKSDRYNVNHMWFSEAEDVIKSSAWLCFIESDSKNLTKDVMKWACNEIWSDWLCCKNQFLLSNNFERRLRSFFFCVMIERTLSIHFEWLTDTWIYLNWSMKMLRSFKAVICSLRALFNSILRKSWKLEYTRNIFQSVIELYCWWTTTTISDTIVLLRFWNAKRCWSL